MKLEIQVQTPAHWGGEGCCTPNSRVVRTVEEALAALRDPGFQPAEQAITLRPIAWPEGGSLPISEEIQLLARTPMESRYRVRLAQPGLLLTRDPWYPGWEVWVNGRPAPLVQADVVLMAVPLPAGESEVVFRYRPWSFYVGALISGITLLIVGPLVFWTLRRAGG
ncbi:MAG: YfhO family protein [Thermoflexus sp.]